MNLDESAGDAAAGDHKMIELVETKVEAKEDVDKESATSMEAGTAGMETWTEHTTENGVKYYHNRTTGATSWTKPTSQQAVTSLNNPMNDGKQQQQHARNSMQMPPDWDKHKDDQGRWYYSNNTTQNVQWTAPGATGGSTGGSTGEAVTGYANNPMNNGKHRK